MKIWHGFFLFGTLLLLSACGEPYEATGSGGLICAPKSCAEMDYSCGTLVNNCGAVVYCGDCGTSEVCRRGQCIDAPLGDGDQDLGDGDGDGSGGQGGDILEQLQRLEGVEYRELQAPEDPERPWPEEGRVLLITLDQPENHDAPQLGRFGHRMVLYHRDENAPLVLYQLGYGLGILQGEENWGFRHELTELLGANQLIVEHRFFDESIAENPRWENLTIQQSARDSNRIVETLKPIYRGPWIGTGASKGGMTNLFHVAAFADDLAGIIPYVAPFIFGQEDVRYIGFLEQIGPLDGVCAQQVKDRSIEMIQRSREAALFVRSLLPEAQQSLEEIEALIALNVLGFRWRFWQFFGTPEGCAALPQGGEPMEALAPWFFQDPERLLWPQQYNSSIGPYSYQVANEFGAPARDFSFLFEVFDESNIDLGLIDNSRDVPWPVEPAFNPQPKLAINDLIRLSGTRIIALYGAWDPWTAGKITLPDHPSNRIFTAAKRAHSVSLLDLTEEERAEVFMLLGQWTGQPLAQSALSAQAAFAPERLNGIEHQRLMDFQRQAEEQAKRYFFLQELQKR